MKKHLAHIFLVPILVVTANYFYVASGAFNDDQRTCNAFLHQRLDSAVNHRIIYFAESSNFTFSEKDSTKKSISELVENELGQPVAAIQQGAIHAGVYKKLVKRLNSESQVRIIILTVNLRSFGINWIESKLETNLSRANIFYEKYPPIVKKFMLNFKIYDKAEEFQRKERIKWHYKKDAFEVPGKNFKSVKEWDAYVFKNGVQTADKTINRDTTELACHFIKNYAFELTDANVRIKDIEEICKLASSKGIKVILHILPENFERAKELVGNDLTFLMNKNVEFIKNYFQKQAVIIDNSQLLKKSDFIDLNWPTEHYYDKGRISVAKNLTRVITKL